MQTFIRIIFFSAIGIITFLLPVHEIDSLAYHLPIAYQLIHSGSLFDIFHSGFVGPNTYFPANHEALMAIPMFLTGSTRFNFLVTLAGIGLFLWMLDRLAKKLNISTWLSFFALLATLGIPFLFKQFFNLQVDLFLFALFGSLVAAIMLYTLSPTSWNLAKIFLLIGGVIGTKYNGVPQVLVLLPVLIATLCYHRKKLHVRQLWFLALPFFTGGFWYVRNWIITGNPIYPFGADFGFLKFIGHRNFLADMKDSSILHAFKEQGVLQTLSDMQHNVFFAELVGRFSLLIIPFTLALLLGMIIVLIKQRGKENRLGLWFFAGFCYLLAFETFVYFQSPYTFKYVDATIRYAASTLALLPVLFVLASKYSPWLRTGVFIFTMLFFSYNLFAKNFSTEKTRIIPLISGNISNDAFMVAQWSDYKELQQHINMMRQKNGAPEHTLALAGLTPYGLFQKEGLRALYVNIDGCETCRYHDYRGESKSIRAHPDKEKWKNALKKAGVSYLLVGWTYYKDDGKALWEERWAEADKKTFKKLLATEKYNLYEIR